MTPSVLFVCKTQCRPCPPGSVPTGGLTVNVAVRLSSGSGQRSGRAGRYQCGFPLGTTDAAIVAEADDPGRLAAPPVEPSMPMFLQMHAQMFYVDSRQVARWARLGGSRCPETTASRLQLPL